jgi:hypothetical protein
MVTVIRVGFVSLFVGSLAPALDILEAAANGTVNSMNFVRSAQYLPALPLLIGLTLAYGALDAGLTAALGIIAALPDDAAGSVVGTVAVGVRLITIAAAGGWFWLSLNALRTDGIGGMLALSVIGLAAGAALMMGALWAAKRLVG